MDPIWGVIANTLSGGLDAYSKVKLNEYENEQRAAAAKRKQQEEFDYWKKQEDYRNELKGRKDAAEAENENIGNSYVTNAFQTIDNGVVDNRKPMPTLPANTYYPSSDALTQFLLQNPQQGAEPQVGFDRLLGDYYTPNPERKPVTYNNAISMMLDPRYSSASQAYKDAFGKRLAALKAQEDDARKDEETRGKLSQAEGIVRQSDLAYDDAASQLRTLGLPVEYHNVFQKALYDRRKTTETKVENGVSWQIEKIDGKEVRREKNFVVKEKNVSTGDGGGQGGGTIADYSEVTIDGINRAETDMLNKISGYGQNRVSLNEMDESKANLRNLSYSMMDDTARVVLGSIYDTEKAIGKQLPPREFAFKVYMAWKNNRVDAKQARLLMAHYAGKYGEKPPPRTQLEKWEAEKEK